MRLSLFAIAFVGLVGVARAQTPVVRWSADRLSVQAVNAPARDLIEQVARATGLELEGIDRVTGTISAQFDDKALLPALDLLLADYNYVVSAPVGPGKDRLTIQGPSRAKSSTTSAPMRPPIVLSSLRDVMAPEQEVPGDDSDDDHTDQDDHDEELRLAEAEGQFGTDATVDSLAEIVKESDNPLMRRRALQALDDKDAGRAVPLLLKALEDDDPQVVGAAIDMLQARTDPASLRAIGELLVKTSNAGTKMEALNILAYRADPLSKPYLTAVSTDRDQYVRAGAQEMLAELARREKLARAK